MNTLERRLQELGRIRIGDQVEVKGKKDTMRPRRLEHFRLTSQNKPRLHAAATLYGGEVIEWPDAPQGTQWQLYTTSSTLTVIVPPFASLSQLNEIWQGGECRVRCNGERILLSTKPESIGQECFCASMPVPERLEKAKEGKACHTVTRLSLIFPDVPGVGVWRLETGSYYAGMELQGAAELLEQASAEGAYIECTLQIEQRRVKRRNATGQLQTQVFPVVTLQPHVSMRQLITRQIPPEALVGASPRPQISQAARTEELFGQTPDMPSVQETAERNRLLQRFRQEFAAVVGVALHPNDYPALLQQCFDVTDWREVPGLPLATLQAAEPVWANIVARLASDETSAVPPPVSSPTAVLPAEDWRSAVTALIAHLPSEEYGTFIAEARKVLQDPTTPPGRGEHLLYRCRELVQEAQEAQPLSMEAFPPRQGPQETP